MAKKKKRKRGRPPGAKNRQVQSRKPKHMTVQSHLMAAANMLHDQATAIEKIAEIM